MNAKKQRAEYKRRRTVAIKKLREAGMSEQEIQEALAAMREELGIESTEEGPSTDSAIDSDENTAPRLPAVITKAEDHENCTDDSSFAQWSEEWWAHAKPETRQRRCKAHTSRDGSRCRNIAIMGAMVCRYHGGASKHVKQAARARIENATERMAKELLHMAVDPNAPYAVKLAAIRDALDRGGLKAPTEITVGPPSVFEEVFTDIVTGTRADYRDGIENAGIESDSLGLVESHFGQSNHRPDGYSDRSHPAPATWDDDDSDPLAAHQGDDRGSARPSQRRARSRGTVGPPAVTGEDAIRTANRVNGLIDAEVYGLPPGRSFYG